MSLQNQDDLQAEVAGLRELVSDVESMRREQRRYFNGDRNKEQFRICRAWEARVDISIKAVLQEQQNPDQLELEL